MTHVTPLAAALACAALSQAALAQGVATDTELAPVVVSGSATRNGLHPSSPSAITSKTAEQLRGQNIVNPEDALQYAPNTTIRKRYIGDRNALIAGRSFGTLQPSRALVYLDGYLISNFLGRFDAPRWNMISPEAIERVDMLYGPYSALLPGNSIGTTVAVTQRTPQTLELSGRLIAHRQRFDQYGHDDHHDGGQLSLHAGNRLESGLWFAADLNHQDATSQPMQYQNVPVGTPGVALGATPVTGITYDTDPKGARRAVFGASGGAIDHTLQDTVNLRSGYRITPELEASMMASWWQNDSEMRNETFLRDASGARVWKGTVTDGTYSYVVPDAAFAPSARQESHQQLGATLKTRRSAGWNSSLVVSDYRILKDLARQAASPDAGAGGTVTNRDGTGWRTAEVQGSWTPTPGDWTGGRHALAAGVHRNAYRLDNTVATATDWRGTAGTPDQHYRGRTDITAVYAQDAWRFADGWKLTAGWREEWFRAHGGEQLFAGSATPVPYDTRHLRGHSPKAALSFSATDNLLLSVSVGRGVRFPNVEELYNGTATGSTLTFADPTLKAETSDAIELSAERTWTTQTLRVSLYHDRVRDAILRQSTTDPAVCKSSVTTATSYTCVQNVDEVTTTGIEFVWSAQDLLAKGVGLDASGAYTFSSKVTANKNDPAMVGKRWLRVPRTRAAVQVTWRPLDDWKLSAGYRHQGRAYNDTYNADVNPDVYGGVSRVNQLDLRGAWKATRELELALGANNATDQRAYQSHPYPGRTLFAELRFTN